MGQWVLPWVWGIWAAIWVALAQGVKPVAATVDRGAERAHYLPLAVAVFLIAAPLPIAWLDGRFLPVAEGPGLWGLGLTVAGVAYSVWARLRLAGNWSFDVTLKQGHELVVEGPYRWTRHPIYSGLTLALVGTVLAYGQWRGLLGLAFALAAWRRRIALEETMMRRQFGAAYDSYARRVKALVPLVY